MENWRKYLKEGMRSHMQTEARDTPRSVAATIEAWIKEEWIDQSVDQKEIADKIALELQNAGVRDDYIADWEDAVYNWLDLEPPESDEGEAAELEIEFGGYDLDVSGDEVTWYFKVNGHEIEVPTIRVFDAEDIAWQLITKLEDDERFPGVDSDDEAQEKAVIAQVDTPEFQAKAKVASDEANEQVSSHYQWEGLKKDSPLLKIIKEELSQYQQQGYEE